MKRKIDELISETRKNKDSRLATFTLVKAALLENEHSKKPISDIEVLQKMVKERQKTIEIYKTNNREDLASKEQNEINIILDLLPKEPSKEELTICIKDFNNMQLQVNSNYKPSLALSRAVINFVQQKYPAATKSNIVSIYKTFVNE